MTAEQLANARASAWRQDGNALLTAEDAGAWLRETGLALFLPRAAQVAAPAPSFVEATIGEANPTPTAAAIENATGLLRRLLASGEALALNLLGTPGDQPDFLATEETLPFLFALHGDREWERGPRGRSSPLVVEVWKVLHRDGALTAEEIKDRLGKQLTETAALRALTELWTNLRVEPVYSDAEGTRWQRLETAREKTMKAGSAMAQGMALSALVSLYLQSSIAATGDEIEAFLSPVASRSRVRDAVRGLTATQQLHVHNLGPREHFYVEGSLPEFAETGDIAAAVPDLLPEVETPADVVVKGESGGFRIEALSETENEQERTIGEGRKRFVAQRKGNAERGSAAPRTERPRKPFAGKREGAGGEKKPFHAREPWKEDRRPVRPAAEGEVRGAGAGARAWRPFPANAEGGLDRPPSDRPRTDRPSAERKSFGTGTPGEARPFRKRAGDTGTAPGRPFVRKEGSGERKSFGAKKPFGAPKKFGERKPFGERKSFGEGKPPGDRKSFDERKPFGAPKPFGERKSFADRKPFGAPPEGGTRPPRRGFAPRDEEAPRPYPPRDASATSSRAPFSSSAPGKRPFGAGARPSGPGGRKPFAPRDGERTARRPSGAGQEGAGARSFDRPMDRRERTGGFKSAGARSAKPRSFAPRAGEGTERPYRPRAEDGTRPSRPGAEGAERRPPQRAPGSGPRKPGFSPRSGADSESGSRNRTPFRREEGADRRPFQPRAEGGKSFAKSPGKPPFRKTGSRPSPEDSPLRRTGQAGAGPVKRSSPAGPARPGGKRPRTTPFTSTGQPRAGVRTTGRPGPRASRPGAGPKKSGGKPRGSSGPRRDG